MNSKMLNDRLVRIESRLVQIMLHLGMNPYQKMYDTTYHHPDPASPSNDSPGAQQAKGKPE